MAKKARDGGCKNCVCSVCGMEGHAPPNKRHRRCPGNDSGVPKAKTEQKMPPANRGTWN